MFRVLKGTVKNKVTIKLSDFFSEQIFGVHIKYDLVISVKLWPLFFQYSKSFVHIHKRVPASPNYGSLITTRDPTMGP